MAGINLETQNSLVIRELITRLRISEVMCRKLHTAKPNDTMRTVQHIMRDGGISGIPIVDENDYLKGIVSVDDIINALDLGYINDPVEKHMSSNVVTLESHLPLSVGLSYFEKHPYRRFPVLNRDGKLAGIVSGRDILGTLLSEINLEVDKLEELIPEDKISHTEFFYRKFKIEAKNMEEAGKASADIKKFCTRSGFSRKLCRRIAVAAFELEINIAVHSEGGSITIIRDSEHIQIIAKDQGPGIPDVEKALTEGFSTASDWVRSYGFGAGMGLPNIKRVCDTFHISSSIKQGTMVTATFDLNGGKDEHSSS